MPVTKEIIIHHYTRSAQWPEGEIQAFATVTINDGTHSATSTEDRRINSPKLAKALKALDEAILAEFGPTAKHVAPMLDDRLPQEVRDQIARDKGEKAAPVKAAGKP